MTAAFTTDSSTYATVNTSAGIGGYDHDYTYDTIGNLTSNTAVASGTTYTYGAGSAGSACGDLHWCGVQFLP